MKAMILAAGRGERMRPLTDTTPKPLLKAGKFSLIEYQLYNLAKIGITEIVINAAYKGEQITATLGSGEKYGVNIEYSIEKPEALDTGGGIYKALPILGDEPFIVINADVWTDYPYENLDLEQNKLAHLVFVDNPIYRPNGDYALEQNLVTFGTPKLTFAGIGIYSPKLFANCKSGKFSLVEPLAIAIKNQQVTGEHYHGKWFNIGTPEQLAELNL